MPVVDHLQILKNICAEEKSKILNRIFFTIGWLLICLLLFVINTLTLTIHLVDNPIEVVIFLYFLLFLFLFWGGGIVLQNFLGWKTLNQLEKEFFQAKLNLFQLNEVQTANYFFSPWYKAINQELAIVLKNSNFCWQQNQKSLQKQNWKCVWKTLIFSSLILGFFFAEVFYAQGFVLHQWTIGLAFALLITNFSFLLPWFIFRQIILNRKYQQYLKQKIDSYQFIFTNRWWLLKTTYEKLEVKDGNFRKSEKFTQ